MTQDSVQDSTILVLGGAGQVGFEICTQLLLKKPKKLVLCDLKREMVEERIALLNRENNNIQIVGEWGNIFLEENKKEISQDEIISQLENSKNLLIRTFNLNGEGPDDSFLFNLIYRHKPSIIIDAVNTATALAYLDPYDQVLSKDDSEKWIRIAASMPIPHLIRHIQTLYHAFLSSKTKQYIKIGTSGTGGLGFTLPYTHGENQIPSKLLMSKTAVAGAQTMLLWVLGRTPKMPRIKEIKVTALIGWRAIGRGEIKSGNEILKLYDASVESALPIFLALKKSLAKETSQKLVGTWIDTGENGLFTRDMFAAITAKGGMELITPSEIAKIVIDELEGKRTGKDVISALDNSVLGPSLVGQGMRQVALDRMDKNNPEFFASIHTLGPLTAKILWEAKILGEISESIQVVTQSNSSYLEKKSFELIAENTEIRSKIITIGIPIRLPGERLLRGPKIAVPEKTPLSFSSEDIERWCSKGWVDLRGKNWERWINWLREYSENKNSDDFDVGEVAGWILSQKFGGLRLRR